MENKTPLEEAQLEVDKSKSILQETENQDNTASTEDKKEVTGEDKKETPEEGSGSGIFTADGEELPEIKGGYDVINPGGTLSDDGFVSV